MKEPLSSAAVAAAAMVIDRELRSHGHLIGLPTYEEMLRSDPIGASEFGGMIERALRAAIEADRLT